MTVPVALVGRDPLARAGIAALLQTGDALVVAEAGALAELVPDGIAEVCVWDAESRSPAAGETLPLALPVVALVADMAAGSEWLAAGARGALHRGVPGERLVAAVRLVAAGGIALDDGMLAPLDPRPDPDPTAPALTPRELEVLALLAEGLSNKEIAARLGISDHTAKFHVNQVLDKLDSTTRTEAVVRGAKLGLIFL